MPRPSGTCATPMRATALALMLEVSFPSTVIVPAIGWTIPEMARSVVVLPAPFAPSRATTSPGATDSVRSRTTGAPS